jgi:hypothetical protein
MADEQRAVTEEERIEEVSDEVTEGKDQTVSREQFEQVKKAQAGSDKKVRELTQKLTELTEALNSKSEEAQKVEKTAKQEVEELRQQLRAKDIREMRLTKAAEAGYPEVSSLIDIDTSSEEGMAQYLDQLNEIITKRKTEDFKAHAKENGRRVTGTEQPDNNLDYAKLNRLSDEEVDNIPKDVLDAIMNSAMKK